MTRHELNNLIANGSPDELDAERRRIVRLLEWDDEDGVWLTAWSRAAMEDQLRRLLDAIEDMWAQ